MRINYTDEEDFSGQFELWQANCRRSLSGKKGQRELRELRAALLALPEKRLIHGEPVDESGDMCAIGVYGKHKGLDLSTFDADYDNEEIGIAGGMPRLVAWKVVEANDMDFQYLTPEARYIAMLAWVERQLTKEKS